MTTTFKKYSYQFTCMTTPCEVQLYAKQAKNAQKIARLIKDNTRRLEKKYNFFSQDSLIAQLNNRTQAIIKIDPETQYVLSLVQKIAQKTQGCFDITTGTLKHCSALASISEVNACREQLAPFMGPDKWQLVGHNIEFSNSQVKIDLGGVIKEYAVDQAGEIAKEAGMPALINFGGDIYVNGCKPDGSLFSVAIKNPKDPKQNIAILKLQDQGLTTSAHYERTTVIEGKSYSHIISKSKSITAPETLKILSATAISDSVLMSGIYSTSLMVNSNLPIDKDVNVLLIDEELRIHQNILS